MALNILQVVLQFINLKLALFLFVIYVTLYILRRRSMWAMMAKLPQPEGAVPLLGHTLCLTRKGVGFFESSFARMCEYSVQHQTEGLHCLWLLNAPSVFLHHPDYLEKLLTSSVNTWKGSTYVAYDKWIGRGILLASGAAHTKPRKLLTPAFHGKVLDDFCPIFDRKAKVFADMIPKHDSKVKDVLSLTKLYSLDTILESSLGSNENVQLKGGHEYINYLDEMMEVGTIRFLNPLLVNMNDFLYFNFFSSGRRMTKILEFMNKFAFPFFEKSKSNKMATESKKKYRPLMDTLVEQHMAYPSELTMEDIRHQLDTFAFAGVDTTANTMAFVFLELANHTDVQRRVRQEIVDILGDEMEITADHIRQLQYLEMVIKETLRLYPPAPLLSRCLREETKFGPHIVPAKTDVWFNIFAVHRNNEFWPEPLKFDPERFSVENSENRHTFAFIPFSAGVRNCIGQKYAMNSMKSLMVHVIKNFELKPITRRDDVRIVFHSVMRTLEPIQIEFIKIK